MADTNNSERHRAAANVNGWLMVPEQGLPEVGKAHDRPDKG